MAFAMVFPGQGSQSLGMMSALAETEPLVKATFAEASEVLGFDLWQLCQTGPEDQLGATANTQPAMLVAGVATWRVWRAKGGALPAAMAGHSLGEYTALVCAEALDFKTAVDVVRFRGQAMQSAVPVGQGAMAAILGLDDADVIAACADAAQGEVVQAANFNSPGQVVIAGQKAAVERAIEVLKTKGAKRALLLPVSVPSHTELMRPAAERMAERLQDVQFNTPILPVYTTVGVRPHGDAIAIRAALFEQLVGPVRWTEIIQAMLNTGMNKVIECGPGKILTGLNRRIERNKDIAMLALEDQVALAEALAATQN
jgi:[acyl-carrier-protein] S-malonyltransferase